LNEKAAYLNGNPALVFAAGLANLAKAAMVSASNERPDPNKIDGHLQRLEEEIQLLEEQEIAIDQAEIGFFQPFLSGAASILSIWPQLPPPRIISYLDRGLADDWQRLQEDFHQLTVGDPGE
jgi:hypothetical protein